MNWFNNPNAKIGYVDKEFKMKNISAFCFGNFAAC